MIFRIRKPKDVKRRPAEAVDGSDKSKQAQHKSIGKTKTIREGGRTAKLIQSVIIGGILMLVLSSYLMVEMNKVNDDATPEQKQDANSKRNAGILVIMLLGATGFLPLGMFFGWMIVDPFQRAKAKRMMFKKNYGIVNFVSRGNKIISKIKDFDKDLLFIDEGVWVLEPNRVYKQSKDDCSTAEEEGNPILSRHIHTIIGIPVIFLDIDTMRPLTMFKNEGDANPIDLASTLKGYIMNQLAKNMFFKKTFTVMSILSITLIAVNLYFTYEIYNVTMDLKDLLPKLNSLADRMDALIKAGQQAQTITQGAG
jgi:hypothetical protein